jgi:hypothetical protein
MINSFFFNNTIRKYVVTFGNVFNNIKVQHGNGNLVGVPIRYITKEKFADVRNNNNKDPNVKVILPMLAYDLVGISYDNTRKTNLLHQKNYLNSNTNTNNALLNAVPFNLDFELDIVTRYELEMLQIVEQILPFFQPSFNVMIKALPEMGILNTDVPIILKSTTISNDYVGNPEQIRHLTWTLSFTMRAWLYTNINTDSAIINRVLIDFGVMDSEDNKQTIDECVEWITDPLPSSEDDNPAIEKNIFDVTVFKDED